MVNHHVTNTSVARMSDDIDPFRAFSAFDEGSIGGLFLHVKGYDASVLHQKAGAAAAIGRKGRRKGDRFILLSLSYVS